MTPVWTGRGGLRDREGRFEILDNPVFENRGGERTVVRVELVKREGQ